jgi:hypothetical protein
MRMTAVTPVWVFFYGTIMEPTELKKFGVTPARVVPAKLNGYELSVRPRPNIAPADRACAFGSLMSVRHDDLTTLYTALETRFGARYRSAPVLVESLDGMLKPALCYIADDMAEAPAEAEFINQLVRCVRTMGFPEWYAEHVQSFAPKRA